MFPGADAGLLATRPQLRYLSVDPLSGPGHAAHAGAANEPLPGERAAPSRRVVSTDAGFDALRQKICEDPEAPRWLETIPGAGYRLRP